LTANNSLRILVVNYAIPKDSTRRPGRSGGFHRRRLGRAHRTAPNGFFD